MTISEKKFNQIFNGFLLLIPSLMLFRKPCSWLIFAFALFGVLYYKKMRFSKVSLILGSIIATPLLLELVFFWNNDSLKLGIKSMEKSTSLLIFPLLILGNYQRVQLSKLLKQYSATTTLIMVFALIRFCILYPEFVQKYLIGTHLWEMGYVFSNSIGMHAPALNMHLAFVCVVCFHFALYYLRVHKSILVKSCGIFLFFLSFFFVLLVNTRMALFQTLLGFGLVFFYEISRYYSLQKVLSIFVSLVFLISGILYLFTQKDPYMKEKYSSVTFAHMDKVGKLDEIKNPEIVVFNSIVTRVSIWKSAWELSIKNLPFGVGSSDGKTELVKYFKKTNQIFLAKYEFPTHNQFLDFLLKYGFLGIITVFVYILTIGYIGYKTKNVIIIFFFLLFFTSNLTDDFLIRFDGIAFSGFWFSIFAGYRLKKSNL
jgi:hypothetical protein